MNEVMLESARQNTALQQALAVSLEMAALAWDDDAADAREFAAAAREIEAAILGAPPPDRAPAMDPNTTPGDVISAAMIKAHSDVNQLLTGLLELALAHVQTAHLPIACERLQAVLQQWRGEHLALEPIGLPPDLQAQANELYRQRIDVLVERVRGVLAATAE